MNYSFITNQCQPRQPITLSCPNLINLVQTYLHEPHLSSSNFFFFQNLNRNINPYISNPSNFYSLTNHAQANPFALIQHQNQLGNLLMNQEQCLQNQIQSLKLLEQILNIAPLNSNRLIHPNMKKPFFFHRQDSFRIKEESDSCLCEDNVSENQEKVPTSNLREQIEEMVSFFLKEFGKASSYKMTTQRNTYSRSKILLAVFDALTAKYSSSGKCKEDMTRFVLRKAISYLRNLQRDKNGYSCKAASLALCKKYFENKLNDIAKKIDFESEEDVLNYLLPYKKNSRNKTANTCFALEIFASEAFYQDYCVFLENFDEIFERENQKKFKKLVDFLLDCIKQKKISGVKTFKRLPWLKTWLNATKIIAEELRNVSIWKEKSKTLNGSKTKKIKM